MYHTAILLTPGRWILQKIGCAQTAVAIRFLAFDYKYIRTQKAHLHFSIYLNKSFCLWSIHSFWQFLIEYFHYSLSHIASILSLFWDVRNFSNETRKFMTFSETIPGKWENLIFIIIHKTSRKSIHNFYIFSKHFPIWYHLVTKLTVFSRFA